MKRLILVLFLLEINLCFGQHWSQVFSPTNQRINSCSFINADTGWIVTNNNIFKTTDGGFSWINQDFPPDPIGDIRFNNTIQFINSNNGIIACGNYLYPGNKKSLVSTILWTNDGGTNWVYKDLGNVEDYVSDAKLVNPDVAYAIGQYGSAKKTTDGGLSWTDLTANGGYSGEKLFPINKDTVYFAGLDNINLWGAEGKTLNGGAFWIADTISSNTAMRTIYFNNYYNGWVGGYSGQIKYTTNAGTTWALANTGVTNCINDLIFTNSTKGWAITDDGKILNSIDAGLNWNTQYNTTTYLSSISFSPTDEIGYAVGDSGKIFKYSLYSGIQSINQLNKINIFPNPATDILNINADYKELLEVKIYDITCRQLLQKYFKSSVILNIQQLSKGIYFYEVHNTEGIIKTGKLVKQ